MILKLNPSIVCIKSSVVTSGGTNLVTMPPSCLCNSLRKGERAPGGGAAKPLLGADWRSWEGGELRGEILDTGVVHYLNYLSSCKLSHTLHYLAKLAKTE